MVRLIDRLDMTLDVYRGRKTTIQQQHIPQPIDLKFYRVVINRLTFDNMYKNTNFPSRHYAVNLNQPRDSMSN